MFGFDVFMAHNSEDKPSVKILAEKLRQKDINPWLDDEQIAPGQWFQDIIEFASRNVKSAAIFIGPKGLGRWQQAELRTFIGQCVKHGLPVIPVLLPGATEFDESLGFLSQLNYVRFLSLDDNDALNRLIWGIRSSNKGPNSDQNPDHNPGEIAPASTVRRDVFIAYDPADASFAYAIMESLKRHHIDVWIDSLDINPGDPEEETRLSGFKASSTCLALVGTSGCPWQSSKIRDAMSFAFSQDKSTNKLIIPVLLPGAAKSQLPPWIGSLRSIDVATGFNELISTISKHRVPRNIPWKGVAASTAGLFALLVALALNVYQQQAARLANIEDQVWRYKHEAASAAAAAAANSLMLQEVRNALTTPGLSDNERLKRAGAATVPTPQPTPKPNCEFRCNDGSCINHSQVCNGQPDCPVGEDEDSTRCGTNERCCVRTNGCVEETGSSCGRTCCCCPVGAKCCPDPKDGCCNEKTGERVN